MIIDFYAHCGCGPGMPHCYSPEELLSLQKSAGVDVSVASDLGTALDDEQIAGEQFPDGLVRFVSVNPEIGANQLESDTNLRGIRIYPTYQEWDLGGSEMAGILSMAEDRGLIVQLCLRLKDPRVMPQVVPSGDVIMAIDGILEAHKDVRFVISGAILGEIRANSTPFQRDNVWTDISHLQHPTNSLQKLMDILGSSRLLFASNAPIFHPYMAVFRVLNSPISDEDRERILCKNAQELLNP